MNFISMLVYIVISLAVGVGLIGISLNISSIGLKTYVDNLSLILANNFLIRTITLLLGILIILIFIRLCQKAFARSHREKTIKYDTEDGKTSITITAIEDMIKRSLEEEDLIYRIKPRILSTKRGIITNIILVLRRETNIKDLTDSVRIKLKDKFQSLLGNNKTLRINIEIRKISSSNKSLSEDDATEDIKQNDEGLLRSY